MPDKVTLGEQAVSAPLCWCGSPDHEIFSDHYLRCLACGTIHLRCPLPGDVATVGVDESGLYGKQYWFEHQSSDLGLPEIDSRSRADLPERNLYWLRTLMKYKSPGARLLEVGCAHGGFVALARQAGYDAFGMELSPAIVDYARRTFQAPVLCGPIERHSIAPGSLDVIVAMDVLEHLPDPLAAVEKYVRLLAPDGLLLVQTPCLYRTDLTYRQLIESNDRFPLQLKEKEHAFLFNRTSIQDFLRRLGLEYIRFEEQLFDYDMFFASSRQPLLSLGRKEIENSLLATPSGRTILALSDLEDRRQRENKQWQESERDRAARLQNMMTLETLLAESQAALAKKQKNLKARSRRLADQDAVHQSLTAQCNTLREQLTASEADRTAGLQKMMALERLLAGAEAALAAEQTALEKHLVRHKELTEPYNHLPAQSQAVREELATSEAERGRLQARILECEAQRDRSAGLLDRVQHSYVYRLMRKVGLWSWLAPESPPGIEAPTIPAQTPRTLRRVAVDLTPVLPGGENGGAKVMTLELIRHLSRMRPDCEFLLLTSGRTHEELAHLDGSSVRRICVDRPGAVQRASDNLAIHARRLLARFLPSAALEKLSGVYQEVSERGASGGSLLRDLKAQLLFCPFTAPLFFDPAVPVVSVIYDLQHVFYPQFFDAAEILQRDRNLQRTIRVASKIVCISEYVRQTVLDHFKISPERLATIHIMAPDRLAKDQPADAKVLASLGLQPERFWLYPANFWPHKNHELLLTVFGMYRALHPVSDQKLVLTGAPGKRRDELIDASRRMGLSEHVVFPGYLPDGSFSALMNGCLAVIFPSLFEGFGMPLLEAMAAGKPVMCSNSTSLPEVAGGAALLFDPRKPAEMLEAITRVEQDSELRRVLRERGAQRVAAFGGPEEMTALYLKVFQEAVQAKADFFPAVYGAFKDGWLKEHGRITVGRGNAPRNLVLKLALPGWAPLDRIFIRFSSAAAEPLAFEVARGESKDVTVPLGPDCTIFEFACAPAFQPHACGLGNDSRALTCQLETAVVVDANGAVFKLESQVYAV
jgi:glycosyltransferase involved in cell wall biosynthesis/SAM-dependent methyltransferase